jgi:hypothetical protein
MAMAGMVLPAMAERQSSIQPALTYVNGSGYFKYDGNDAIQEAAHYPLILGSSRWFYERPYPNNSQHPYELIHELNPATRITNYANGPHARNDASEYATGWLNLIARWSVSRGHPGGTLNFDHGPCYTDDHWFLLKSGYTDHTQPDCGNYLFSSYGSGASETYWLDFGSQDVREYWAAATINDLLHKIHSWPHPSTPGLQHPLDTADVDTDRLWKTDGLFIDSTSLDDPSNTVTKYDPTAWAEEMASFIEYATETIRDGYPDQDMYFNVGGAGDTASAAAWATLDGLPSTSRPTGLLEEDAFVVHYGANEAQYWLVDKWLKQVNTLRSTSNLNAVFESHTDMLPLTGRDTGNDMNNEPLTYWSTFWYAMSSYLLGKNDIDGNSYFVFYHYGNSGADAVYLRYPDENDLDIGKAVADYASQSVSATDSSTITIYKREYEKGWVFVNPNAKDSVSFTLPDIGKPIDHDTFQDPVDIANTDTLAVPRHRGIVVLKDPVIGYWRLDEASGSSAADSHEFLPGDSMGGTAYGSPTWLPSGGVVGGAIQFDGSNDYIAVAHDTTQLETPETLSISYWVKPDSGTTGSNKATVMQFGTWNASGWQLWTGSGWNEFAFTVFDGSPSAQSFFKPYQSPLPTNQWSHLAVTVENKTGGNVEMYLNGEPFHHDTLNSPFVTTGSDVLYLGAHAGGTGGATYWGGKLDNVKIQRKVLTPYEVAAEYRSLVADWRLDEPAYRRKAFDNYGAAHGTVYGNPEWLGTGGSGSPLGAIQLDGVDDEIVMEHNAAQLATPTQFTINAWVQPASDTGIGIVMAYGEWMQSGWLLHAGAEPNEIGITLIDGLSSYQSFVADAPTPITLSDSTWTKVTVTVDNKVGGEVKLYVDDASVPLTTSTLTAPMVLAPGDSLAMGASGGGYWKGKLGHVQLFSRILTATEIAQLTN